MSDHKTLSLEDYSAEIRTYHWAKGRACVKVTNKGLRKDEPGGSYRIEIEHHYGDKQSCPAIEWLTLSEISPQDARDRIKVAIEELKDLYALTLLAEAHYERKSGELKPEHYDDFFNACRGAL